MFRKLVTITMVVSFVAMATSGLMMTFIEKPSFTLKMHPVHKSFGFFMVLAAIPHIYFNFGSLKSYFKEKAVWIYTGFCVALLVALYGVSIMKTIPEDLAKQMDEAAELAEHE